MNALTITIAKCARHGRWVLLFDGEDILESHGGSAPASACDLEDIQSFSVTPSRAKAALWKIMAGMAS